MSNKAKRPAVPRLRFPEFRDARAWEPMNLGQIGEFISGGTPDTTVDEYWGGEIQWFTPTEIKERFLSKSKRTITEKGLRNSSAKLLPKGALLLSTRATVGDVGIAEVPCTTNQGFQSLVVNDSENNYFWYYWILQHKEELLSRASGSTFPEIGKTQIVKIPAFRASKAEQQKIAACLSSLDDLLAAESAKLDALKAHKRGLMQGLFPAEGETVPRLRFREFEDSGEWTETALGKSLSRHPEYGIGAPAVPYSEDLPTYLRITDISDDGQFITSQKVSVEREVTEDNYLDEGDIALARTGASVGKSYKYRVEDGRLVFAGFLIRVKPDVKKLNAEFLFQFLSTEQYWRWIAFSSARSGQPGINGNEYSSMPLPMPPSLEEQQRIADTLSSLDELITAQSQKIEALRLHKRGLMQGLFPTHD